MCTRGKKKLLALYALIKTTSGTQGERSFLCTLLAILLLTPCRLTISRGQKPVDRKQVTDVSQKGFNHQIGSHPASEAASKIH